MSKIYQRKQRKNLQGFAYLTLLIVLALLAISASAVFQVTALLEKRAAEEQLLAIGMEFKRALTSYANATPPGAKRWPNSLEQLLKDTRSPVMRRHLRKVYVDPITHQGSWGLLFSQDGSGIVGVHSLSQERPIKIANFSDSLHPFENQNHYSDWVFTSNRQ